MYFICITINYRNKQNGLYGLYRKPYNINESLLFGFKTKFEDILTLLLNVLTVKDLKQLIYIKNVSNV